MILNKNSPDWRIGAHFYVREDCELYGQTIKSGTLGSTVAEIKLTKRKTLSIPIPNTTAILLGGAINAFESGELIRSASQIDISPFNSVNFKTDTEAFDYIEKKFESIILSFTAIESFANEVIPENFQYAHLKNSKIILEIDAKPDIERYHPLEEKLLVIIPEALNCKSPKGLHCWKNFKYLKDARNKVIHLKTEDRRDSVFCSENVWDAIFKIPKPHEIALFLIDHFVSEMDEQPFWHAQLKEKLKLR